LKEEPNMNAPVLLTVKEVAETLGFSERTVYRLADSGAMPRPVKIGAAVRWRRNELDQWIEDGCPAGQRKAKKNTV
jgi:excisionase family DNA binding protein